ELDRAQSTPRQDLAVGQSTLEATEARRHRGIPTVSVLGPRGSKLSPCNRSERGEVSVESLVRLDDALRREQPAGHLRSVRSEGFARRGVASDFDDRAHEAVVVTVPYDAATAMAKQDLARRADVEGNDRGAAGQALDHAASQALALRRQDDQIEGTIPARDIALIADEVYALADP